jgi:DNA-directed RNA polymerase specialized sigma24 family protein
MMRALQRWIRRALERKNDTVQLAILLGESDAVSEFQPPEIENLEELVRLLPRSHAEIFRDVYHHKMTFNDVAQKMKLSPQRAQAIYARAVKMLRRRIRWRMRPS